VRANLGCGGCSSPDVLAADKLLSFENSVWVGAEEMNRYKGRNYLTVFTDMLANWILFATPGKDASVWDSFAGELRRHYGHPKAIQCSAIDMMRALHIGSQ
jgi:hypothetical protein